MKEQNCSLDLSAGRVSCWTSPETPRKLPFDHSRRKARQFGTHRNQRSKPRCPERQIVSRETNRLSPHSDIRSGATRKPIPPEHGDETEVAQPTLSSPSAAPKTLVSRLHERAAHVLATVRTGNVVRAGGPALRTRAKVDFHHEVVSAAFPRARMRLTALGNCHGSTRSLKNTVLETT